MSLVLITPPTASVVSLDSLCAQLKVTDPSERLLVQSYEQAAVAHLDGWGGILGRAIMAQVWKQEFCGWGTLRLALPDVSAVVVTALDSAGVAVVPTRAELRADTLGPYVLSEGPAAERVFVEFTCALSPSRLPAVQQIVRLIVAHWYENREATTEAARSEIPLGATALMNGLRWRTI